jgi:hypothetical protein
MVKYVFINEKEEEAIIILMREKGLVPVYTLTFVKQTPLNKKGRKS